MKPSEQSYDQPEKEQTRQRVIARAVESLSKERDSSPVVTAQEFERTMGYCLRFLEKVANTDLHEAVKPLAEEWHSLHQSRVGTKRPEDLSVLFLAGPNPKADLMAFKKAGIPFTNIWAVESDNETFSKAVGLLGSEGIPVKVYNGTLQKFFSIYPQQFDIVYFDSCTQLFGGSPNTIHVLRELFLNQRLAPLSVLITNFCEPCPNMDPDLPANTLLRNRMRRSPEILAKLANAPDNPSLGLANGKLNAASPQEKELLKWGRLLGLWRYFNEDSDDPPTEDFDNFVDSEIIFDLHSHYSRFTTEFIIKFAGQLLPWWRVFALPGSRKEYFSNEQALTKAIKDAEKVPEAWFNPLYSSMRHVMATKGFLDPTSPLHELYFEAALDGKHLGDAVKAFSLIRTFMESQGSKTFFPTEHIRAACSPGLVKTLENFIWLDDEEQIFCYPPFPHLITDLFAGLYGCPYHANTRKLGRIAYKACDTIMFTDVFVFDQARYLYDLLPTLPLFDHDMAIPEQLVLRVCMDAIRRHSHFGCPDLFYLSDLAALGEEGFTYWSPPRRESLGCPAIEVEDSSPADNECPI